MGSHAATGATRAGVRVATLQTSGAGGQPQSGERRSSVPSSRRRPISGLARHWGSSDATASPSAGRRTGAARGPACLPPPRKSQFEILSRSTSITDGLHSTVQVRAPKPFHDRTLWPEFCALADEFHAHLDELTTRVIREAINDDVSEPEASSTGAKALPEPTG